MCSPSFGFKPSFVSQDDKCYVGNATKTSGTIGTPQDTDVYFREGALAVLGNPKILSVPGGLWTQHIDQTRSSVGSLIACATYCFLSVCHYYVYFEATSGVDYCFMGNVQTSNTDSPTEADLVEAYSSELTINIAVAGRHYLLSSFHFSTTYVQCY